MSYADSLLAHNEKIILRARQHPLVLAGALVRFGEPFLIGLLAIGAALFLHANVPSLADLPLVSAALILALVLWAYGAVRFADRWLTWHAEEYLITTRRVVKIEGLFNKRSADSALEQINDAVLVQSALGRYFGYGDLQILTAAEAAVDNFYTLRQPVLFKKAMLDAKMAYERSLRGYAPNAPSAAAPLAAGQARSDRR
jgi:hypothetical protein